MNGDLNSINSFQFNNLVQNRVPFLIVNLGVHLAHQYRGLEKMHIERHSVETSEENALKDITSLNIKFDHALVVICQDGFKSQKIASLIEQKGFINVYTLKNGYNELMNPQDGSIRD